MFRLLISEADDWAYSSGMSFLEVPTVGVSCGPDGLFVSMIWDTYIASGDDIDVQYRFDDGAATTQSRYADGGFVVLNESPVRGLPDGDHLVSNRILNHDRLVVRVWDYFDDEVGWAAFPITGLSDRVSELQCT